MTTRSAHHATFVVERTYPTLPARTFAAWASKAAKARWFACHDEWVLTEFTLDFRVGGEEHLRTGPAGGTVHAYDAVYQDIVPGERIVYAYGMRLDETRISVSLTTVEFRPEGTGSRLVFTEQVTFLDGYDGLADREEGTRVGLDNLGAFLHREAEASAPGLGRTLQ